jgi:hypothetical protein
MVLMWLPFIAFALQQAASRAAMVAVTTVMPLLGGGDLHAYAHQLHAPAGGVAGERSLQLLDVLGPMAQVSETVMSPWSLMSGHGQVTYHVSATQWCVHHTKWQLTSQPGALHHRQS